MKDIDNPLWCWRCDATFESKEEYDKHYEWELNQPEQEFTESEIFNAIYNPKHY